MVREIQTRNLPGITSNLDQFMRHFSSVNDYRVQYCPLANDSLNAGQKHRKFQEAKEISKLKILNSNLEKEKETLNKVKI